MRIDQLLSQHTQQQEINYSKFTDPELDRIIELLESREYDFLPPRQQAEIDGITTKAMER